MLVILLAWIYITLLCCAWGMLVLQSLKHILKDGNFLFPHFSILCLTGFAAITVFSGILSLLMPLSNWEAQLIIITPCLLFFLKKRKTNFLTLIKSQFTGLHPALLLLLIACLVMLLTMSSWKINHPDTLAYHAQTIQWIEKYKAIPGLVHLHDRFGLQGLWFTTCAFFSFKFTGIEALTFINSAIITWFLFFVIQKISKYISSPSEKIKGLLWLALLAFSFLSYSQIRLTATSASPDFVATMLLWTVFYLLTKKEAAQSSVYWLLLITLSIFSITIKLSAAPILIVAFYSSVQLLRLKKLRPLLIACLLAVVTLFPFFARNIITSGYLVFPLAFPDIVTVDWKFDKDLTRLEKNYITAYARTHVIYNKEEIETVMAMPPEKWLPVWWKSNSAADKTILAILVLSLATAIIRLKKVLRSHPQTKIALFTALAGVTFWFIQAPDPRFGFGFIEAFIAIVLTLVFSKLKSTEGITKKMIAVPILVSGLVICSYTGYRFLYFFSSGQIVRPLSIENKTASPFQCEGLLFNKPENNEFCGTLSVPCIYTDSCSNFILRGDKITDGFRARDKGSK